MKVTLWPKCLLLTGLSFLTILSAAGCQKNGIEKPEDVLLMTSEQVGFYENLYGKKLDDVLKALDLTEDDLRDPAEIMDLSDVTIAYLLPDTVNYNGVEFYLTLVFASNAQEIMEPETFRGIWFTASPLEPDTAIEISQQLFEDALELYGENTDSYYSNSLLNPVREEAFLNGEEGFADKWYLNNDQTFVRVSGKGSEEEQYAAVAYEIHLSSSE